MFGITAILGAAALAATVYADSASVTIETSHSGAGNDLTNETITVPLNTVYTNDALNDVSYLFLTSATGVNISDVSCTPYLYSNGTGDAGNSFNSTSPAYLSTTDVQVGSLVCSDDNSTTAVTTSSTSGSAATSTIAAISSSSSSSNLSSTSNSTMAHVTSTFITTMSATSNGTTARSTVTSIAIIAASTVADSATTTGTSTTSSTAASLASGAAAGGLELSGTVAQFLALLGFGIAFVL